MSDISGESLRRTPAQDRSTQRLELILDTTARLLDEVGYPVITPALIAREAGMSGPAVYRYFADLDAIITALSARVRGRFLGRLAAMLEDESVTWELGVANAIDIYVDMYRNEPSFRVFRLQGGPHLQPEMIGRDLSIVASATIAHFQPRYDTWDRPLMREHIEVMIEIIEALVHRAFEADESDFFISEAKRVSVDYLADFLLRVPGTPPAESPAVGQSGDA